MTKFGRMAAGLLMAALLVGGAGALEVGDAAPGFELPTWLVGEPVNPGASDGKSVYLVQFWMIPCPACDEASAKLNLLHKQFFDQGLRIVAVNAEDEATTRERLEVYQNEFPSALDPEGVAFKPYMHIDGRDKYPHAFLVGRDGQILWIGNPLEDDLERMIRGALDGTFTVEQAKAVADARRILEEAGKLGDPGAITAALEKLMEVDTANPQWPMFLHRIAMQTGRPDLAEKALERWKTGFNDDADVQVNLAAVLMTMELSDRDPVGAAAAARRALALDAEKTQFSSLAAVQALLAIGLIEEADKVLAVWKGENEEMKTEVQPDIDMMREYIEKLRQARATE